MQHCLTNQVQKVEEIVKATTFSNEQIDQLKILSPETNEAKLESLLRIKVLRCLVIWTQALVPAMLNQKMSDLNQTNPNAFSNKMAEQDLFGSAMDRISVVN